MQQMLPLLKNIVKFYSAISSKTSVDYKMYMHLYFSPLYSQGHGEYLGTSLEPLQQEVSVLNRLAMVNRSLEEGSQYEYIKCVVVGDAGVGKTCLTCAWACGTNYTLERLVKTPASSVWAIDHYRNDQEVTKILIKSICFRFLQF